MEDEKNSLDIKIFLLVSTIISKTNKNSFLFAFLSMGNYAFYEYNKFALGNCKANYRLTLNLTSLFVKKEKIVLKYIISMTKLIFILRMILIVKTFVFQILILFFLQNLK